MRTTDEQISQFESAVRQFSTGEWPSAKELFQNHRTTDRVSEMYLRYMAFAWRSAAKRLGRSDSRDEKIGSAGRCSIR